MIELTQYQRQWVEENKSPKRSDLRTALLIVALFVVTTVFVNNQHESVAGLANNIATLLIYLYVAFECIALIGLVIMSGLVWVSEVLCKELEDRGEEWKDVENEKMGAIYLSFAKYMKIERTTVQKIIRFCDYGVDIYLFIALVASAWPVIAIIHGAATLLTHSLYGKLVKKFIAYVKNLTPPENPDEDLTDLTDRLFNETDQI